MRCEVYRISSGVEMDTYFVYLLLECVVWVIGALLSFCWQWKEVFV